MADNNVVFPRKLVKRFIALYKEQPCLWDKNCPAFKNKRKRHEAIAKLTELVQKYDPAATKVHVMRKLDSMRACVRREYRKVCASRAASTSPDEGYLPHLWYYELLSFVFGDDGSNYQMKEDSSEPSPLPVQHQDSEEELEQQIDEHNYANLENYNTDYNVETCILDTEPGKHYYEDTKKRCEVEDEYDAIGINVAAKLRTLPQHMRILAEKLINDVLYQAQTRSLTTSAVVAIPDPIQ